MTMHRGSRPSTGHWTLPHTADVIIEAWAPTREACIAQAVTALVESFVDTSQAHKTVEHRFRIPANAPVGALVAVLEEALFLLDTTDQVPITTTVTSLGANVVTGSFTLARITDRALTGSLPKGISLSRLAFAEADGHWKCRFTVDV